MKKIPPLITSNIFWECSHETSFSPNHIFLMTKFSPLACSASLFFCKKIVLLLPSSLQHRIHCAQRSFSTMKQTNPQFSFLEQSIQKLQDGNERNDQDNNGLHRRIMLLDGGTGEELFRNGVPDDRKIWSATAVVHSQYHSKLKQVHESYFKAGSNAVTTNSYGITFNSCVGPKHHLNRSKYYRASIPPKAYVRGINNQYCCCVRRMIYVLAHKNNYICFHTKFESDKKKTCIAIQSYSSLLNLFFANTEYLLIWVFILGGLTMKMPIKLLMENQPRKAVIPIK